MTEKKVAKKIDENTSEEARSASKEKKAAKPSWIKMKKDDVEKLVVQLAKEGKSPAQIGLELRDKHGIPKTKLFGKRISQILKEHTAAFKDERAFVEEHVANLRRHLEKNKHDYPASRALTKKLWVINKFERKAAH